MDVAKWILFLQLDLYIDLSDNKATRHHFLPLKSMDLHRRVGWIGRIDAETTQYRSLEEIGRHNLKWKIGGILFGK